jgi:putative glutamine transport system substrate-binding protein
VGKARLSVLAVLLATLGLTSLAQGDMGTLGQIKARGVLRVGVRTASPPFGFIGEHGENKGFDVDMARWLSKELFGNADAVEFIPVTPGNGINLLNAGKMDILADTAITAEGRKKVAFSVPYFVTGHLILVRDRERPLSYRNLSGKKIATVAGSTSDTVVRKSGATSVRFNTIAEAVRALHAGQVDAVVAQDEILFAVEKEDQELKMANWQPFEVVRYGLAVRKGSDEWLSFVNDRLTTMLKTSEYRTLLEKWFGMVRGLLYKKMLSSS